ncbi:hypothetical protein KGP54_18975 [Burkholderia multivorans]|nr:hypothetical protein [Burkholderia multivorans]MCO8353483.1 hypothetical protein [Burkholderia multivorans]MCO8385742.1 hypothetical protein [Burkholderia multivorans]MCO8406577.1 hypothetical protein [Burkholderia multivorans]MCO8434838.1 hypothetical protein [Burkholderia multivorans]MCO8460686.1 hypothetical protein [Burkholderia multivorans]
MVTDEVSLWDVKPLRNAPTLSVLSRLATQIYRNRLMCRASWWQIQQTICLDHAPVRKQRGTDDVLLVPSGRSGTGTIVKGSGIYVPGQGVQVRVHWGTSVTTELLKEV